MRLPVIDLCSDDMAAQLHQACGEYGFFYLVNHGVDEALQIRLEDLSRKFFAQDLQTKLEIQMSRGGRRWRGYFPLGGELTSGQPDLKEGIYFGAELSQDHPLVKAGTPLHGPNLFPKGMPEFRQGVLDRLTGGRYRWEPHRVKHVAEHDRLSFAFFFDPNFNAEVRPIRTGAAVIDNRDERWDHASVHEFRGTYGDYLLNKISKVFPE